MKSNIYIAGVLFSINFMLFTLIVKYTNCVKLEVLIYK